MKQVPEPPLDLDEAEPAELPEPLAPEIAAEFRLQATPTLRKELMRFAKERAKLVRKAGRKVDRLYIDELVQDALGDTWNGTLRWNPRKVPLLWHIQGAISCRAWHDAERAKRREHVGFDHVLGEGKRSMTVEEHLTDAHASQGDLGRLMLAATARAIIARLAPLAERDPAARALLLTWSEGIVHPPDVMERTGLSAEEYKKARLFILRRVDDLPAHLRDDALDLLRRAS